jgi:hypothetical protein
MLKSVSFRILTVAALLAAAFATAPSAQKSHDYTQIGRNLSIGPGEQAGDVTCVACSIHIRGQVAGDATAVGGSIYLEDQAQVAGDVTAVAGSIRLESEVKVGGDATVVGGTMHRTPGAQVSGDVTSVGGTALAVLILISPFLFLGLIAALVIWLVQRNRRDAVPAAAA